MQNVLNSIKAQRAIKGYSQEYMANILGIDYSSYGKMENGHSKMTVQRLYKIAEILGLDILQVFGFDGNLNKYSSNEAAQPKIIIEIPISTDDLTKFDILNFLNNKS